MALSWQDFRMKLLHKLNVIGALYAAFHFFIHHNKGRTFRQKVFALLHPTPTSGPLHRYIDHLIILSVLVSVLSIIFETIPEVQALFGPEFKLLEVITVSIFSIEYLGRVYSCCELPQYEHPIQGRLRYMTTVSALIDLLAISPFFLDMVLDKNFDLRFLRVFRLSRLLKLTRYTGTLNTLFKAVQREHRVLLASAFMMMLLVILTASLGFELEHDAQPDKFESIPASMYWAVITLASVGYGDISPITPLGRAMTVVISLIGIGIFAIPAGLMASAFTDQLRIDRETFENEFRKAIADGRYSSAERHVMDAEAERLHLSPQDVNRIIERVHQEMRSVGHDVTEGLDPEVMRERYRQQISALRAMAHGKSADQIDALLSNEDKSTAAERAIWQTLREK